MVVPVWGRVIAAVAGGSLVVIVWCSVIGALIVPRQVASRLTRIADRCVNSLYQMVIRHIHDYRRRDRLLATQGAAILLGQLAIWLAVVYLGFSLLLWPFEPRGVTAAFITAGSSLFTLGFDVPPGTVPSVVVFLAAGTGLVVLTLQIAYLPTLYAAFNRRETDVALLNTRAGVPSWGPELLARTHYALGSGVSTINTMPDLYAQWERWAADVAESHTTYLTLVRFRSPRPLSSWVTALLAVLDSAAMYLALCPQSAPVVPARLCLRSGMECFRRIAQAMGYDIPDEADPNGRITLTYDQFVTAVERLREVDFPIERDPVDAWPDFVGWRLNYEDAAYLVAGEVDAVHALWSGPRVYGGEPVPPIRPGRGRVPNGQDPDPLSAPEIAGQDRPSPHLGTGPLSPFPQPAGDRPSPDSHTEPHERAQLPRVDPGRLPAGPAL